MRVELLDRLRMMHGKTIYNCDFSEYIRYIESMQADNAALKEQVAQLKSSVQHEADCVDSAAAEINRQAAENDKLKETIAQQAEVIEQMRDVFKASSMDTETINRKAPEIAKDCCSMPMPDTYGMYHLTDEEVCNVVSCYLYWLHKNQPINLQPSPEILQARDEKVAEAIAKMTDEVCSLLQTADKSDDYVAGVGNAVTSVEESIERGEWRKYL